jgi:hypothetical protein
MLKHIRLYLSFYIYLFFLAFVIGGFSLSSWMESFDPPQGIVINFQGQIIGKENILKEKRQGVKFWQHQLIKVRARIKSPEEFIELREQLKIVRADSEKIKNSIKRETEDADLVAGSKDLEQADFARRYALSRRLKQEADQLLESAERVREDEEWRWLYKESMKNIPDYVELEKIIIEKIITYGN